jgi:hypothetical protein
MSVISSIMEFIRGKEEAAQTTPEVLNHSVSLPPTSAEGALPPTPSTREGYMPDNSNSNYVNRAWKDQVKSRSMKGLIKKAEESDDEKNARLLQTAKEPDSQHDAVNQKAVKWTDADQIRSMEARARLEEGERKREEARLKREQMRKP